MDKAIVLPSPELLGKITETEPQVALIPEGDHVAAAVKLHGYDDMYLYVARLLDPRVVQQLRATQESVGEYANLEARRLGIQIAFALMFAVIALIVLLSSAWIGLDFANRLVAPIRRLIGAANVVSTGNLHIQVPVHRSEGDLAHLGETFNKMTQELRTQHEDIVRARDLIDSRRRFTEAVLAGASAGVIGVNADGRITILNRSAERLIGRSESEALGLPLAEIAPELAEIFQAARSGNQRLVQRQVTVTRDGQERNFSVRVTSEQATESEHGYVITIDDITELVLAQRSSAWADIARRIAHEIKNPLTPIQLSAERLRRKYGKLITEDAGVFEQCTDTIVRQVDDIKRMVDEFSRFARMPKAVIADEDVADTVRQVVFLLRVGHPDIDFEVELAAETMPARFDRRLISQALTNIIKNATEAIGAVPPAELGRGHITVARQRDGKEVVIDVIDNGIGLPKENRARLLEPYVTTREKGTGLGLAIVGRILEEHGGRIELRDASEKIPGARGAWMQLRFAAEPLAVAAHSGRTREGGGLNMASDILIVDDEADIRELVAGILQDEGHGTRTARDSDDALAAVVARRPNLVFLDIWLQGSRLDGLQLLDTLKQEHPELPIVMISGHGNIETAVSAIKRGAYDFIEKPFKADRLLLVADRALENSRLKREVRELKQLGPARRDAGRPLARRQSVAADGRESGADQQPHPHRRAFGQRQGARRAHHSRPFGARQWTVRGDQCRRHHAGAHGNRAVRRRAGQRATAARRAARSARSKRRMAARCSSTKSPTCRARRRTRSCACWSTRLSSASAAAPRSRSTCASSPRPAAISRPISPPGKFREDLYHRLSVVPIRVPALAERREDIPELVEYFMTQISQTTGLPKRNVGADALAVLQSHDWPGNVRQLRNNVERLMILAGGDPEAVITASMLPQDVGSMIPNMPNGNGGEHLMSLALREAREVFEREYLLAQINRFGGNISRTAEFVGMERSALHRKLKALGID